MKATDIRFTPQHVLDVVREFATIALDPCTTADNPVRAVTYLTAEQDGLAKCWSGVIADHAPHNEPFAFVNPPYSTGQLIRWATKAVDEWERYSVECALLVPADTSTRATQLLLEHADGVAFWKKRICFAGETGAKFANAVFYLGDRIGRFRRVFSPHASVLVLR